MTNPENEKDFLAEGFAQLIVQFTVVIWILTALVLILALAGCGGGEEGLESPMTKQPVNCTSGACK